MLKSFLKFSFGSWVASVISLITVPITTLLIAPSEFGKSTLFVLWTNILLQFILLGGDSGFMRFFYQTEPARRGQLLLSSIIPSFFSWIIISCTLIYLWRNISTMLIGELDITIIWLLILQLLIMLFERYSFLIVRMQQKGICFSIVRILASLITALTLILYAKYVNADFYAIIYSALASLLTSFLILVIVERKLWFSSMSYDKMLVKKIFKFGFPLLFTGFIAMFFEGMDKIMLRHFSTFEELGIYNVAFKIVAVLAIVQSSFSTFWVPLSYKTYEKDKYETSLYEDAFKYVSFILVFLSFIVIGFRGVLVHILDQKYYNCIDVVPFLVFMPISYTLAEITTVGINFMNKTKYYVYIFGGLILVSLLFYSLFVPLWGAKGAALALSLSYLSYFLFRTVVAIKLYPFRLEPRAFVSMAILFITAFVNTFISLQALQLLICIIGFITFIICNLSTVKYMLNYLKQLKIIWNGKNM